MNDSRITVSVVPSMDGSPDEVEISLNDSGLKVLIQELIALDRRNDHFHMFTEDWGGDELRNIAYSADQRVSHHLKVLFRPDDWDREHFPHVMPPEEKS